MTTRTFSTVIEHTSDATFRAWALEVSDALDFVGMPKSADTGQINLATASRPALNTAAGYEIRYIDDALHSTAPIYIKIEYGTSGGSATRPAMWLTVGTGSNGSGTITGTLLARQVVTHAGTPSTSVPSPTYVCRVGGQFGFAWKSGVLDSGTAPSMGAFLISRTTDDDGADTAAGVVIYALTGSFIEASSRLFAGSTYSTGSARQYCMVPYSVTASLIGADNQAFRHYAVFPQIRPVVACVTVLVSEVPAGSTISVTPIGSTARTYLSTGFAGRSACVNGSNAHTLAMIWE